MPSACVCKYIGENTAQCLVVCMCSDVLMYQVHVCKYMCVCVHEREYSAMHMCVCACMCMPMYVCACVHMCSGKSTLIAATPLFIGG